MCHLVARTGFDSRLSQYRPIFDPASRTRAGLCRMYDIIAFSSVLYVSAVIWSWSHVPILKSTVAGAEADPLEARFILDLNRVNAANVYGLNGLDLIVGLVNLA
jgi:hypothetical protein